MNSASGGPVDVPFVILHRLEELGLEQQALARAAHVTESYISQLLTRRKAPPAPNRTDIYDRMDKFLKLPSGELAKLADLQRKEELKRELGDEPAPLFHEVRELILRKCNPERQKHVRAIFETQPFGEEPGLQEFLQDSSLSGTATPKEVAFLKRLKFQGQRPTPLYYYRELQSLRDPLHFRTSQTDQGKGT